MREGGFERLVGRRCTCQALVNDYDVTNRRSAFFDGILHLVIGFIPMWVLFRPEKQVFDLWSGWSVTLSRLFVTSFSRYPEYERCNSAACTRVNAF